jgi:hypothetical protein
MCCRSLLLGSLLLLFFSFSHTALKDRMSFGLATKRLMPFFSFQRKLFNSTKRETSTCVDSKQQEVSMGLTVRLEKLKSLTLHIYTSNQDLWSCFAERTASVCGQKNQQWILQKQRIERTWKLNSKLRLVFLICWCLQMIDMVSYK